MAHKTIATGKGEEPIHIELSPTEVAERKIEEDKSASDHAANGYKDSRVLEYPGFDVQFDMIYHDIDNWRSEMKAIKDKYPKPV